MIRLKYLNMSEKVWATSEDGRIEYISLTSECLDGALQLLEKGFYGQESVCTATGLSEHPEAASEVNKLCIRTAKDGISIVALEKETKMVVGVAFNKLQVKNNSEDGSYFENFAKSCKYESSRAIVQFMQDADAMYDLFEHCNVDCLLELTFLGTHPEFRRKGIALKLCEVSTELAKMLLRGNNVKTSIDGRVLKLHPVPKMVAALFTSPASQKIGRKLEWNIAVRISYEKFFHQGKSFASILGGKSPDPTLEFKKL